MSELQIWIIIYLAVGMVAHLNDHSKDGDRRAFGIVAWPFCILLSMVNFK